MTTTVGLQDNFMDALQDLVQLDYDAVAAYEVAINRISVIEYKKSLENFKKDHEEHIKVFSEYLEAQGVPAPEGPGVKSFLTQGKVVLANLVGNEAILWAMRSNEQDTNIAYERLNSYQDIPTQIKYSLTKGLEDEKSHAEWLDNILRKG